MKKYYLHNGTESSGPFDIEELKAKKITKASPVWFEGMLHWKTAGVIPELNQLFIVNPAPFSEFIIPETKPKTEINSKPHKILGLSKNTFLIGFGVLIILIGIGFLNAIQKKRSQELKLKNHKTEIENYKIELKQKELDEQKIQEVIQEKIDAENRSRELSQKAKHRLLEIEKLLDDYQNNLIETEKKLQQASESKLLRTGTEKKQQMDLFQKNIDSLKNEINLLENEAEKLKMEMEKIPK